jgi:hypothetical protein
LAAAADKNIPSINVLQRQLSKPMEKLRHRMHAADNDGGPLLAMAVRRGPAPPAHMVRRAVSKQGQSLHQEINTAALMQGWNGGLFWTISQPESRVYRPAA